MLTIHVKIIVNTNHNTLAKSIADTNTNTACEFKTIASTNTNMFYCFYIQQRSFFVAVY